MKSTSNLSSTTRFSTTTAAAVATTIGKRLFLPSYICIILSCSILLVPVQSELRIKHQQQQQQQERQSQVTELKQIKQNPQQFEVEEEEIIEDNQLPIMVAGGYTLILNPTSDERLQDISKYIMGQFSTSPITKYSFRSIVLENSSTTSTSTSSSPLLSTRIVSASRQVVAGMNYRLTLEIIKNDTNNSNSNGKETTSSAKTSSSNCIGALTVTVYDHFGELSILSWGDEITC